MQTMGYRMRKGADRHSTACRGPNPLGAPSAEQPSEHLVQFYESEAFLNDAVASYIADGFQQGQSLVVIATRPRIDSVQWRLANRGYDVDRAHRTGELVLLDAHQALRTFMVGNAPDRRRFQATVGSVIERSLKTRRGAALRAYGEMVDVLWRDGNREAAIQLEELWNELARQHSFSLLCAYALGNFHREADEEGFRIICQGHSQVLPAETYDSKTDEPTRARQVALLQQRAHALEHEIEERKKFERALRDALVERLRTEDALRTMKEEAERASEAKSQFLAVMSHELRTPLNAIIGYQDLMTHEVGGPLTNHQRGYLDRIRSASQQLLRLIDQILSLSRIEAGNEEVKLERLNLAAVARETVSMVEPTAVGKGLTLLLRAPETPVECVSDVGKLRQILLNLLSNAVKFTDQGGIEVEVAAGSGAIEIRVRDTGPGIPESDRSRIFEPFVQADTSATRRHGGTGLGLPVSRELARMLGGDVHLKSITGEGSTFTLELPASPQN